MAQAQYIPGKVWDKRFGTNQADLFTSMVPTADGGFLLGGNTVGGLSGDKTILGQGGWLVKIDAAGNKVWDKTFGTGRIYAIAATPDGGFLLGQEIADFLMTRFDAAGNQLWAASYGGSRGADNIRAIVATADGGFLLGGYSSSPASGNKTAPNKDNTIGSGDELSTDYWVVRIDGAGTKLWDKSFGTPGSGSGFDRLTSLLATSDGGFLLGGYTPGSGGDRTDAPKGDFDYWVIKIDATGTKVWDKAFGSSSADLLTSMVPTADGGFLVGGYSNGTISGDRTQERIGRSDFWVVKIDAAGTKVWDKAFGSTNDDQLNSMLATADGGFLLAGWSGMSFVENFLIIRLDAAGTQLWSKEFGGSANDKLISMLALPDGGLLLGGTSGSNISGDKTQAPRGEEYSEDYWVVRTDRGFPQADLRVSISPATRTANEGETQTYTVTVTNAGPNVADKAIVEIPIPLQRTLVAAQPAQGTYDAATQRWTVGRLTNGASSTLSLTLRVD